MSSILLVCTGNICRSPLAESFLRRALADRFGDRAPLVSSAGTMAMADAAATPEGISVAAEYGLDTSGHTARLLEPALLRDADLILGMGADHLERVLEVDPDARARTFTLKELVRLLEDLSLPAAGQVPTSLVDRVVAADDQRVRTGTDHIRGEEVADPIGYPVETYRATASELAALCDRLVEGLFGPRDEEIVGESRVAKP